MLDDGTYDAIVFDVDEDDAGITVELTILGGDRKGEAVSVRSPDFTGDALDLLGIPATITVEGGVPRVAFEP